DAVCADVHAVAFGERARLRVRAHVEAGHDGVRGRSEHDVALRDRADASVDDIDRHLGMLDLRELADDGLDGALDVALDDDVELLDAAFAHAGEEVFERDALLRAPGELLGAHSLGAQPGEMAGLALVLDDARVLAGGRRLVETQDLDRGPPPRLSSLLAAVVVERAHLAPG